MIPKHPVAVSKAKKKLPLEIDWGKGIPKDRLRYINAREEALIKLHRSTNAERSVNGVKSYADDSASSKGVSRGVSTGTTTGKTSTSSGSSSGNGGLGQGGQGSGPSKSSPSSSSSAASTGAKSASTDSKSTASSSQSAPTSKAPNAAAQAAADKLNSTKSTTAPAKTNATASPGISKTPNAAAQAASDKLKASQAAAKAQSSSIQGMINQQTGLDPRAAAAKAPSRGNYQGKTPDKFTDLNAAAHTLSSDLGKPSTANWSNDRDKFNDWGIKQLASFTGRSPGDIAEMARTTYGEAANQGILGRAAVANVMENRLNYGNRYGGYSDGDIRGMLKAFDANGYDFGVRKGVPQGGNATYQDAAGLGSVGVSQGLMATMAAKDPASTFNTTAPDAIRNATHYYNPRDASPSWGKGFTAYGDHVFGNPDPGSTQTRVAGLRNNNGALGLAAAVGNIQDRMDALDPRAPAPSSIPAPSGMLGDSFRAPAMPQRDPAAAMARGFQQTPPAPPQRDPAAASASGLMQSTPPQAPTAPEEQQAPPGYFSQFAMTPDDINRMKSQAMKDFGFGQLMEMNKNIGALPAFMGPITRDQEAVKRQAAQAPAAPGPAVAPPIPTARPPSQNMQTPPGWGQERVLGVENYTDLNSQRDPAAARAAGLQQSMAGTTVAGDPRVGMSPGAYPAARNGMQSMVAGDPRVGMSPGGLPGAPQAIRDPAAASASGLTQSPPSALPGFTPKVAGDPRVGMPTGGFPAAPSGNPDTFSPEAAPGDSVPEDAPVYSDNPIQGPSNPMQEGFPVEDPAIQRDRQKTYAERGATIGGIVAGPLGTIVGATLGWQMGKTNPAQRQAIASNPRALAANVQSINQLADERGGKGNPQMRVTQGGMHAVLTNPRAVVSNPQQFTSLEQMLAQLALGNNPETGKPI